MDNSMIEKISEVLKKIKEKRPLVHAITNYVTVNDCANVLLAIGASPAMVESPLEAKDFASISNALYVNLGTLTNEQELAIYEAGKGAQSAAVPIIMDPVGCGAIARKLQVLDQLQKTSKISLIKGNLGEIQALAGLEAQVRGVDSIATTNGVQKIAAAVSKKYECTVAVTGKEDFITDGERFASISNGVEMLTMITGAGCMLGAICAATAAVCEDIFTATVAAVSAMGIAGEMAYERTHLPGSFRVSLIDSLYLLDSSAIRERSKLYCE